MFVYDLLASVEIRIRIFKQGAKTCMMASAYLCCHTIKQTLLCSNYK